MKPFVIVFLFLIAGSCVAWRLSPARTAEGRTVLLWTSDDNPARRGNIELFDRLHPNYYVHLDPDNGEMEKVIVQSLGGVGPDVFDCYGPDALAAYVKAGIAWDITDELAKAGVNLQKDVWSTVLPYVMYEGRLYGVPANASCDALLFNKDVFDKAGIPYPTGPQTWQEFVQLAERLTVRDEHGRIQRFGFTCDKGQWQDFLYQWGGQIYSEDGTRCTLDSPQAIAAIQFMHDLIYRYRVAPSPGDEDAMAQAGGWGFSAIKFIGSGRAATALGGRWWFCTLRNYQGLRLGVVPAPAGPTPHVLGYGKSTLINKASPHRQQALDFLLYMTTPQYTQLINDQADGLGPMMRYCTNDSLINPAYPSEDSHHVFRDMMPQAQAPQISPFVNTALATRLIEKQLDLVRRDAKSAEDALKTAAAQVNRKIQQAVRRDPALRRRYERLTAHSLEGPSTDLPGGNS